MKAPHRACAAPRRTGGRLALAALALAGACSTPPPAPRFAGDPTVLLRTEAGGELGVSTSYGVVFLGRGARSGEVEFEVHFVDGPSFERGIVEPLGDGLYVTRAEIQLPTVPLAFDVPAPGTRVLVRGRWPGATTENALYELELEVAADERVDGLLLDPGSELTEFGAVPMGAGVFVEEEGQRRLVGLVTGELSLAIGSSTREYLTVAGPDRLGLLVSHGRDNDRLRRRVYRRDVLP